MPKAAKLRNHLRVSEARTFPYLAFLHLIDRGKYYISFIQDRVYRIDREGNGITAGRPNRNGYMRIPFRFHGRRYEIMEHIVIWIYFKGFPPAHKQIDHINGVRDDPRLSNLELVTQSENIRRIAIRRKGLPISSLSPVPSTKKQKGTPANRRR